MPNSLEKIASKLTSDISSSLSRCGLMFRTFTRVKTESSIKHQIEVKYAGKKVRIQDMILRHSARKDLTLPAVFLPR